MANKRKPRKGKPADSPKRADPPEPRKLAWFRTGKDANSPARDEFIALPATARAGLSACLDRYQNHASRFKDVDHVGEGIYELRYRSGNNHYRLLFILAGQDMVGLTAFYKNQRAIAKHDLDRALRRARLWRTASGDEPNVG